MNARRRDRRHARHGVALVLVLWLVALLSMVAIAASSAARSSSDLVSARRADATARAMAESGISVALVAISDSLRALVGDSAKRDAYLNALDAGANGGRSALAQQRSDTVGEGAFVLAVVDVSARLDVNEASVDGLTRILSPFAGPTVARAVAERIAARVRGDNLAGDSAMLAVEVRDSVARALLGRAPGGTRIRHPFESLDELRTVPGLEETVLTQVAPLLTVDGDAHVNRRTAPVAVVQAASGTIVDAPTRLLIVARGWQVGHPLSHEIQAVYDVSNNSLQLVRWRERTL